MKDNSLKKNYLYNLIYQVFIIITPFITTPYVSRVLGASAIGEYSYGLSIATYFGIIGTLGITTYAQIAIGKNKNTDNVSGVIGELFITKCITMIIAILFYLLILVLFMSNKKLFFVLLLYLLSQFNDVSWILQGLEQFKKLVFRNIITKIFSIVLIFILVKNSCDIYKYTMIMQGVLFIGNFLLWPYVWDYIKPSHLKNCYNINNIKCHLKNSIIFFVPTVATMVYTVLDKSMIGWITHSSLQNGYYEQAHKIEQIIVVIITSLGTVTLPRISYLNSVNKISDIKNLIAKSIHFVLFLSIPMCFGLIAISNNLIPVFLGNGYDECIILLKIFSVLLIIVGLDNIIGRQCLMAMEKQKQYNVGVILGALVNVIINLLLIPKYGAIGAAISSVISEVIILFIFATFSMNYLKNIKIGIVIKFFISSIIMFVLVSKIHFPQLSSVIELLFRIIIGGLVYFVINIDFIGNNISSIISRK